MIEQNRFPDCQAQVASDHVEKLHFAVGEFSFVVCRNRQNSVDLAL